LTAKVQKNLFQASKKQKIDPKESTNG